MSSKSDDTCPGCGTALANDAGIGLYCPNDACAYDQEQARAIYHASMHPPCAWCGEPTGTFMVALTSDTPCTALHLCDICGDDLTKIVTSDSYRRFLQACVLYATARDFTKNVEPT